MAQAELSTQEKPIRIGVFSNVAAADHAVQNLLEAGFTKDEISVICSDPVKERHFKRFEKEEPAGTYTMPASVTGGAIGAALGGLTALTGVVATGGIGLLGAGAIAAWAGGVFGGLIGAMTTRGVERETADFYDQAVAGGKILVAAEDHGANQQARLAAAAHALAEAGAEPLPLREG
jgi:hypothetical protein